MCFLVVKENKPFSAFPEIQQSWISGCSLFSWPATQPGKALDLFARLDGQQLYEQGPVQCCLVGTLKLKVEPALSLKEAQVSIASKTVRVKFRNKN